MCLPPRASSQVFEGSEEVEEEVEVDSTSAGVGIGFPPNLNGRVKLEKVAKEKVSERSEGGVHHSTFWRRQRHTPAQHHHPALHPCWRASAPAQTRLTHPVHVSSGPAFPQQRSIPPSTDVSHLTNSKFSQRQHEEGPPLRLQDTSDLA